MNRTLRPFSLLTKAILVVPFLVPYLDAQTADATPQVAPAPPAKIQFTPMTPRDRFHRYIKVTFAPTSFLSSAFGAGIAQWRDLPYEWGQGAKGYGRRYASSFGRHIVNTSLEYGFSSMLHEDNRFFRSRESGIKTRGLYVVKSTFLARRDDGSRRFSYSRMGSIVGASLISRAWHPHSARKLKNASYNVLSSYGITLGFNAIREFWPRKHR